MPDKEVLQNLIQLHGSPKEALIAILRAVQKEHNYLPEEELQQLSTDLDIPYTHIRGVATFYSSFRLEPAGKHFIKVCTGTACHIKGAEALYQSFKDHLSINADADTDADKMFTMEKVACLGCCMLAPAIQIDEKIYGPVFKADIPHVIDDFLNNSQQTTVEPVFKENAAGTISICRCSSCVAAGANNIFNKACEVINRYNLPLNIEDGSCTGDTFRSPILKISTQSGTTTYDMVKPEQISTTLLKSSKPQGVFNHLKAGVNNFLEKILLGNNEAELTDATFMQNFETRQQRVVTLNGGSINPRSYSNYLQHDGFKAYKKVISQSPDEIITELEHSGLRGRGGGGFPTYLKWQAVKEAGHHPVTVICNGDEGDPGAFMDRMLLETFPYRVLEGMLIAAYVLGADECILYIRDEYPLAVQRINAAIKTLEKELPENKVPIRVVCGAGAFVCGEETALLESLKGNRGTPQKRPPYPSECGFRDGSTLVNNVETFATIPRICIDGGKHFATTGCENSHGTKTFALAGNVKHGGLVEVPLGTTTIREIVNNIGGGVPEPRRFKAVQIGGPSGGCLPAKLTDTKLNYDLLKEMGTIIGSGGLIVLDDSTCMVEMARYFMQFTQQESCGKCRPCRVGTSDMLQVLEKLCRGEATADDVDELEKLANDVAKKSFCGLGKTAPNPVLSTLRYFKKEYEDHVKGICTAKSCKALIDYTITDRCIGCGKCAQACPVEAITGAPYEQHTIDPEKCTRCDSCRLVCPENAIKIIDREK